MTLNPEQKKYFRRIGHQLKPVLIIAENGIGETHLAELERALEAHELIKVKINLVEREDRSAAIEALLSASGSVMVQTIGKVVLLYRKAAKPNPRLSNLLRFAP